MDNKNFGTWLLSEIDKRGWSQSDLARASKLTRQAINYYVRGKSKSPNEEALHSLAKALSLPPELVFRKAGLLAPKTKKDELIETILYELDKLPQKEREEMLEYIRLRQKLAERREESDH